MAGRLLFSDEFNSFDPGSKTNSWSTSFHWGPETVLHDEKGYYVDTENGAGGAPNPFSASNGVLTITAAPATGLPNGQSYATGVLSSLDSFERQYGYFEMRAELPAGDGFFPAFWLLPADKSTRPELDIMEYSSRLPNEYANTLHSTTGGSSPVAQEFIKGLPDLSDGFHTYAVDWQPDKITWYFDDKALYSAPIPGDFHEPMYMLLNQAVGGGPWIGPPDGSTQEFSIDYVRVYDGKPAVMAGAQADTEAGLLFEDGLDDGHALEGWAAPAPEAADLLADQSAGAAFHSPGMADDYGLLPSDPMVRLMSGTDPWPL